MFISLIQYVHNLTLIFLYSVLKFLLFSKAIIFTVILQSQTVNSTGNDCIFISNKEEEISLYAFGNPKCLSADALIHWRVIRVI